MTAAIIVGIADAKHARKQPAAWFPETTWSGQTHVCV
jgi:hypothetical protein